MKQHPAPPAPGMSRYPTSSIQHAASSIQYPVSPISSILWSSQDPVPVSGASSISSSSVQNPVSQRPVSQRPVSSILSSIPSNIELPVSSNLGILIPLCRLRLWVCSGNMFCKTSAYLYLQVSIQYLPKENTVGLVFRYMTNPYINIRFYNMKSVGSRVHKATGKCNNLPLGHTYQLT